MSKDVITLHKSRWITLRSKPDRLMRVTSYTRPMAYCITLIIMYSSFLILDQRILQINGNTNMWTIKDVHKLSAHPPTQLRRTPGRLQLHQWLYLYRQRKWTLYKKNYREIEIQSYIKKTLLHNSYAILVHCDIHLYKKN